MLDLYQKIIPMNFIENFLFYDYNVCVRGEDSFEYYIYIAAYKNVNILKFIIMASKRKIDEEIQQKKEIIQVAKQIKKKYDDLKSSQNKIVTSVNETFAPIIKPLEKIEKNISDTKISKTNNITTNLIDEPYDGKKNFQVTCNSPKNKYEKNEESIYLTPNDEIDYPFLKSDSNIKDVINDDKTDDDDWEEKDDNTTNNELWQKYKLPPLRDLKFGLHYDKKSESFSLGKKRVKITNNFIIIDNKQFERTEGLIKLLTQNVIGKKDVTPIDVKNYYEILEYTKVHRRKDNSLRYVPTQTKKYNFIKSLVELYGKGKQTNKYNKWKKLGGGLSSSNIKNKNKLFMNLMVPSKNKYQMVYYDNSNELIDRLKILTGEQMAGNESGQISNEIQSIIEELRENEIII